MKDSLPKISRKNECAVINLDTSKGRGTHWVAYKKHNNIVEYFDSFGNLKPPKELIEYFKSCTIMYNRDIYQKFNTYNCGHLCLQFLLK